jgi:hypothetical protein
MNKVVHCLGEGSMQHTLPAQRQECPTSHMVMISLVHTDNALLRVSNFLEQLTAWTTHERKKDIQTSFNWGAKMAYIRPIKR